MNRFRLATLVVFFAMSAVLADDETETTDEVNSAIATVTSETGELQLDTTTVTGNRELPKVLAIVPWKKALPPELAGQPDTSLLERVLQPLERDVFQRELRYLLNADDQNETESADKQGALSSDKRARPEE